jgi:hypothetical protein
MLHDFGVIERKTCTNDKMYSERGMNVHVLPHMVETTKFLAMRQIAIALEIHTDVHLAKSTRKDVVFITKEGVRHLPFLWYYSHELLAMNMVRGTTAKDVIRVYFNGMITASQWYSKVKGITPQRTADLLEQRQACNLEAIRAFCFWHRHVFGCFNKNCRERRNPNYLYVSNSVCMYICVYVCICVQQIVFT